MKRNTILWAAALAMVSMTAGAEAEAASARVRARSPKARGPGKVTQRKRVKATAAAKRKAPRSKRRTPEQRIKARAKAAAKAKQVNDRYIAKRMLDMPANAKLEEAAAMFEFIPEARVLMDTLEEGAYGNANKSDRAQVWNLADSGLASVSLIGTPSYHFSVADGERYAVEDTIQYKLQRPGSSQREPLAEVKSVAEATRTDVRIQFNEPGLYKVFYSRGNGRETGGADIYASGRVYEVVWLGHGVKGPKSTSGKAALTRLRADGTLAPAVLSPETAANATPDAVLFEQMRTPAPAATESAQ